MTQIESTLLTSVESAGEGKTTYHQDQNACEYILFHNSYCLVHFV